jgi:hypothetical protein
MNSLRSLFHTLVQGLIATALIAIVVTLLDIAVFRWPIHERQNVDSDFETRCQSLPPDMKITNLEEIFRSFSSSFAIEKHADIVNVRHRSMVCTVRLVSGTNSIANSTLLTDREAIGWEE